MSRLKIQLIVLGLLSSTAPISLAKTQHDDLVNHIAQDDKLVLKQDLDIPANQDRLNFFVKHRYGRPYLGCALVLQKSPKSRRMLQGTELTFSGENEENIEGADYGTYYILSAGIKNSEAISGVECYGFYMSGPSVPGAGKLKDIDYTLNLDVLGMKSCFRDFMNFVAAEPEIIH